MSAPPLGPSELGGAFCLYQRTQVLFPFRRRGRRAAGASFPPPQPEPTGFNYKRPAKPSAPPPPGALPWADKHREARLQGPRERSPSPLPAIPGRAGLQPLIHASRSAFGAASIRGGMETRECAWARSGRGHGACGAAEAPSKHPISRRDRLLPKPNFLRGGPKRLDSPRQSASALEKR